MNNMENLEKTYYISMLFDFYSELLTSKQKEYFAYYYFDNYSLSEIAEIFKVTRSAVYDQIKITCSLLEDYEKKLNLYKKYEEQKHAFEEIKNLTTDENILSIIKRLEKEE